jgi:hypothetical protein
MQLFDFIGCQLVVFDKLGNGVFIAYVIDNK